MGGRVRSAGLALAALGAVTAMPALAGTEDAEIGEVIPIMASTMAEATAECPGKQRALGGGIVSRDPLPAGSGGGVIHDAGEDDLLGATPMGPLAEGGFEGTDAGDIAKSYAGGLKSFGPSAEFKVLAICE